MAASIVARRATGILGVLKDGCFPKSVLPVLSRCGCLLQVANYNPRPLKLNIKSPYIPDKESENTPEWQKTDKYDRKLFGRYGSVSGVNPAKLWPSPEELDKLIAEEKEWQPSLEEMLKNVEEKEMEKAKKQRAREKLIAANMAKMPKMIEDWRRETRALKQKKKEDKARKERLIAEARERFGYALDPRSPKFQEMVQEMEKEEKKKKKLLKSRMRQTASTFPAPPIKSD
ncbi:growth arrest and DNA damage-inducible proteins-interacting protein 1-like [Scleropages formosus]|uniref:Large ribosomal subunit protein mL64 n=1 Tax=Scleropages formosus TaxID=113540 RepID=A0A0P7WBA8_SCLFO|nr:growth arrest and DNA damage-inducible proteins-interacting protein 1 [Scleropages formosus]KPP60222.1 growth arrest and DNA damage-inducible proteins-interacting protein 1-like [Scleropages formosus]